MRPPTKNQCQVNTLTLGFTTEKNFTRHHRIQHQRSLFFQLKWTATLSTILSTKFSSAVNTRLPCPHASLNDTSTASTSCFHLKPGRQLQNMQQGLILLSQHRQQSFWKRQLPYLDWQFWKASAALLQAVQHWRPAMRSCASIARAMHMMHMVQNQHVSLRPSFRLFLQLRKIYGTEPTLKYALTTATLRSMIPIYSSQRHSANSYFSAILMQHATVINSDRRKLTRSRTSLLSLPKPHGCGTPNGNKLSSAMT